MNQLDILSTLMALNIKKQFKQSIALCSTILLPSALFHCLALFGEDADYFSTHHTPVASWVYVCVAASVAFFGLSLSIIERRENCWMRSFIHHKKSKAAFLIVLFLAYFFIASIHHTAFFLIIRASTGEYLFLDYLDLWLRLFFCYLLFCIPSLLFTLAPVNYKAARRVTLTLSFFMLILGVLSAVQSYPALDIINSVNPLPLAHKLMVSDARSTWLLRLVIGVAFIFAFWITLAFLEVDPVVNPYS